MSKSLRLSEKWFHRGLWVVAFLFAWFLTGLGNTIVADLPKMEAVQTLESFIDQAKSAEVKAKLKDSDLAKAEALSSLDQAELKLKAAQTNTRAARDTFETWMATRQVTQRSDQDESVMKRRQELDTLRELERGASQAVNKQRQLVLDLSQSLDQAQLQWRQLESQAQSAFDRSQNEQQLRVFGFRLALTLPLLVLAGWLFKKHRQGAYWPFVWGFVIFAVFTFFVELVPYLPSWGGYVRYTVGIVVTMFAGRYVISGLQRYLENQKKAEALPDNVRRQDLDYDLAQARLTKGVCPGCERSVDLKDAKNDFCSHCGLCLFNRCGHCTTRKSAFARFCFSCGSDATTPAKLSSRTAD